MRYFILRGEKSYGPYTLQHLRAYVESGNIGMSEMARGEQGGESMTVSSLLAGAVAPQAPVVDKAPTPTPLPAEKTAPASTSGGASSGYAASAYGGSSNYGGGSAYGSSVYGDDATSFTPIRLKNPLPQPVAQTSATAVEEPPATGMSASAYLSSVYNASPAALGSTTNNAHGVEFDFPEPPKMHWLGLLLIIVGGFMVAGALMIVMPPVGLLMYVGMLIFILRWTRKQVNWASLACDECKALETYVTYRYMVIGAVVLHAIERGFLQSDSDKGIVMAFLLLDSLLSLAIAIAQILLYFRIRRAVRYCYISMGQKDASRGVLPWLSTLLLGLFYMQYHMTRLQKIRDRMK